MRPGVGCSLTGSVVRNIGGPLGVRSALAAGAAGSSGLQNEIAAMHRDAIHLLVGTPAKLNEILNSRGSVSGGECRLLIVRHVLRLCRFGFVSLIYNSWTRWTSSLYVEITVSCKVE
jgi:superfamily II DNA/RNA helicase